MNDQFQCDKQNGVYLVTISGAFNASLVKPFRAAFDNLHPSDRAVVIDLALADTVDSAALGLLIHMRKRLKEYGIHDIAIINTNARIRKTFHTMRFEDYFDIDMLDTE